MGSTEPSSLEEKRKSYEEHGHIERWLFVSELRKLLNDPRLKDDDWLTPNEVYNLLISREGAENRNGSIGIVNFRWNELEFWGEEEDEEE